MAKKSGYIKGYDTKNGIEKRFRNSGLGHVLRRAEWAWLRWLIFKIFVFIALVCVGFYVLWTKSNLLDDYKKTLEWSEKSNKQMSWYDAKSYCDNLNENGSEDWSLPTIDELRTQINCHATEPDGECRISEINGKLSENDWTEACKGCGRGGHGKLGDTDWLWSSSFYSGSNNRAWSVYFNSGIVQSYKKDSKNYVRCVRKAGSISNLFD